MSFDVARFNTYRRAQLRAGRLTCVSCGCDLGDASDPYRDPDCSCCARSEYDSEDQAAAPCSTLAELFPEPQARRCPTCRGEGEHDFEVHNEAIRAGEHYGW